MHKTTVFDELHKVVRAIEESRDSKSAVLVPEELNATKVEIVRRNGKIVLLILR